MTTNEQTSPSHTFDDLRIYPLTHTTDCVVAGDRVVACKCGFEKRAYEAIRLIDVDLRRLQPLVRRTIGNERYGGTTVWRWREAIKKLEDRRFELMQEIESLTGKEFVEPTYEFKFEVSSSTVHGKTQYHAIPLRDFACNHAVDARDEFEARKLAIRDHVENCLGGKKSDAK